MSNWQKITPTSPTGEEGRIGIRIGYFEGVDWVEAAVGDKPSNPLFTHWQPIIPPPRPDPAKEACDTYLAGRQLSALEQCRIRDGWYAALAWVKEGKK